MCVPPSKVFWDVMLCWWVNDSWYFEGLYYRPFIFKGQTVQAWTGLSREDEGIMILQSVRKHSSNHKVYTPNDMKPQITLLWKAQLSCTFMHHKMKEYFSLVRILSFSFQTTPNKLHILVSTEFISLQPTVFD